MRFLENEERIINSIFQWICYSDNRSKKSFKKQIRELLDIED